MGPPLPPAVHSPQLALGKLGEPTGEKEGDHSTWEVGIIAIQEREGIPHWLAASYSLIGEMDKSCKVASKPGVS